jgi:hypothetical protein
MQAFFYEAFINYYFFLSDICMFLFFFFFLMTLQKDIELSVVLRKRY